MEMLVIVGLGLVTLAIIERQNAAMRRIMKARIKPNEHGDR